MIEIFLLGAVVGAVLHFVLWVAFCGGLRRWREDLHKRCTPTPIITHYSRPIPPRLRVVGGHGHTR